MHIVSHLVNLSEEVFFFLQINELFEVFCLN